VTYRLTWKTSYFAGGYSRIASFGKTKILLHDDGGVSIVYNKCGEWESLTFTSFQEAAPEIKRLLDENMILEVDKAKQEFLNSGIVQRLYGKLGIY
jgi:hypothetical protein